MRAAAVAPPMAGLLAWQVRHRTAPAVRGWSRPQRVPTGSGPLHATSIRAEIDRSDEGQVVVLLHGITASGTSFGGAYDHLGARAVVVDLLGFGGSMRVPCEGYTAQDHVDAVMATLHGLGVADRQVLVVGHSMGAVLALHLAARMPRPVGVVALSAPLYDDEEEGLDRIGAADPLAGLLAVGDLAERVCHWMCEHRRLARATWPILAPHLPWSVAADGVLHTWPAYRGSLQHLVLDSDYLDAVATLDGRGVPLRLVDGGDDGVQMPGRAAALADRFDAVTATTIPGAGHPLPLSHAAQCAGIITKQLRQWA